MPGKPAPDLGALLRYRQKRDFARTPERLARAGDLWSGILDVMQDLQALLDAR